MVKLLIPFLLMGPIALATLRQIKHLQKMVTH